MFITHFIINALLWFIQCYNSSKLANPLKLCLLPINIFCKSYIDNYKLIINKQDKYFPNKKDEDILLIYRKHCINFFQGHA